MDTLDLITDALLAYLDFKTFNIVPKVSYTYEKEQVDYPDAAPVGVWKLKVVARGLDSIDEETGEPRFSVSKEFEAQGASREEATEAIYKEVQGFLAGERFFLETKLASLDTALTMLSRDRTPMEEMWPSTDANQPETQAGEVPLQA
jgi:hypothetical protein